MSLGASTALLAYAQTRAVTPIETPVKGSLTLSVRVDMRSKRVKAGVEETGEGWRERELPTHQTTEN